jgi:multidrug efflux pump subunit AcrA (membrane-fusion protein)
MSPKRPNARSRKYRLWLVAPGLLAAAIGAPVLCSGCGHEAAKAEAPVTPALEVTITQPAVRTLRRAIVQPAIVKSYEETPIYSKITGFFKTIYVDIGDTVRKGQLLAEIRVPEVEEDVRAKEARVVEADADIKQSQKNFAAATANVEAWESKVKETLAAVDRTRSDVDRWDAELKRDKMNGTLDKKTLDEVEHQLKASDAVWVESKAKVVSARASLDESRAKAKRASAEIEVCTARLAVRKAEYEEGKAWLGYASITAPFDGVVTRRVAHTEHFVQPANSGTTSKNAEPLFVVMRTDRMRVVVQVPEDDAPLIKPGEEVVLKLQAYRGKEINCRVTRMSWALDHDMKTQRVEIFIDNPGFVLTDAVFKDLRVAKVSETILGKLAPFKNKEMNRKDFRAELTKVLTPDEMKDYQFISGHAKYPPVELQPGMYGSATIYADLPNTLCLPADAILTDGNVSYCYIIEDGKARKRTVRVGTTNDRFTEVMKKQLPPTKNGGEGEWVNLTGTEQVVTSNLKSLQDGQPVKAKQ